MELWENPQHRWTFDNNNGVVVKDSVGNIDGTCSNVTFDKGRVGGGRAVGLRGTSDSFVTFGTGVGQFGTGDFTVSLWFKTTETLRYFDLISNRIAASHGNFFSLRMTGNHESLPHGMVVFEVDEDTNGKSYVSIASSQHGLNDGNWHHVAAGRSGTTLALYVDGQRAGYNFGMFMPGASAANIANGNPLKLGQSLPDCSMTPVALYDDLRVYNSFLGDSAMNIFSGTPIVNQTLTLWDKSTSLDGAKVAVQSVKRQRSHGGIPDFSGFVGLESYQLSGTAPVYSYLSAREGDFRGEGQIFTLEIIPRNGTGNFPDGQVCVIKADNGMYVTTVMGDKLIADASQSDAFIFSIYSQDPYGFYLAKLPYKYSQKDRVEDRGRIRYGFIESNGHTFLGPANDSIFFNLYLVT